MNIDKNKFKDVERGVVIRSSNIFNVEMNDHINGSSAVDLDSTARNGVVSKNSFIDLEAPVIDRGSNSFDDGTWGNYWSDMEDYHDWDGDGIVDHPIYIDADSVDRYPLIVPWGQPWNRKIELDPFIANHRVEASRWLNLTFTATDPDGDLPYFEIEVNREVEFGLDNETGEFSYRPKKEDLGLVEFSVTVYDRNGTRDTGKFVVEVLYLNLPPELEPVDNITTYPGIRIERELFFNDPNGDKVVVYVDSTNAAFRFSIKDNRYLVFTAGDDQTGVFWVKLTLSDGNGSQSNYIINVFVIPYDVPPVIGDMFELEAYVGETSSFVLNVSDVNEDELTISVIYDGNGSCWAEGLFLNLRPDITDIGNRTLTVSVDDNNGSVISRDFTVSVFLRNRAPVGPMTFSIRVEAGDVQRNMIVVSDPDGDELQLLSVEPGLSWLELLLGNGLQITTRPTLLDVSVHELVINITDGKGTYLNIGVRIEVYEGPLPNLNLSATLVIAEKQRSVHKLGTDYERNGTVLFRLITDNEFIKLEGDELSIAPVHGDHGVHRFSVETSVVGGTSRTTEHLLNVSYDLSKLKLEIKIEPEKEHYLEGDSIKVKVGLSGYDAQLPLRVVLEKEGVKVSDFEGMSGSFELKEKGTYSLKTVLTEHGLVGNEIVFTVKENEDQNTSMSLVFILIGAIFLVVLVLVVWLLIHRSNSEALDLDGRPDLQGSQGPDSMEIGSVTDVELDQIGAVPEIPTIEPLASDQVTEPEENELSGQDGDGAQGLVPIGAEEVVSTDPSYVPGSEIVNRNDTMI